VLVGVIGCKKEESAAVPTIAPVVTTAPVAVPQSSSVAATIPAPTQPARVADSGLQSLFDALLQLKADITADVGPATIEPHLSAAQLAYDKWEPSRDSSMRSQTCAASARRAIESVKGLSHLLRDRRADQDAGVGDLNREGTEQSRESALKEIEAFRKSFESAP
jgi:hypothetical protein